MQFSFVIKITLNLNFTIEIYFIKNNEVRYIKIKRLKIAYNKYNN